VYVYVCRICILYVLLLQERDSGHGNDASVGDDTDSDDDDNWDGETDLEVYSTPIDAPLSYYEDDDEKEKLKNADKPHPPPVVDEFITFKGTLLHLSTAEPAWYQRLFAKLNEQQQADVVKLFTTADQRANLLQSKEIAKAGGYKFDINQSVPSAFNFGA